MKKRLLAILSTFFAICCFVAGCAGNKNPESEVRLELNTSSYVLNVGDVYQLTANVVGADDADIEWTSSDEEYLTVNYNGRVTALKGTDGATVKVSASVGDVSDSCEFEIKSVKNFPKLCTDVTEVSVYVDGEYTIRPYVTYMGNKAVGVEFGYSVADESVAEVSDSGVISGKAQGQTKVTISAIYMQELLEEEITVTVKAPEAFYIKQTEIVLNKSVVNPEDVTEKQLNLGYYNHTESSSVSWSSDNPDVAIVDNDGLVTSVGIGKAKITAVASFENEETLEAWTYVYVKKSVVAGVIDLGTLDLSGEKTIVEFSDIGVDSYSDDEVKVYDAVTDVEYPASIASNGVEIISAAVSEGYQTVKVELFDRIITVTALAMSKELAIPIAGSDGKASLYVLKDSGILGSTDFELTKENIGGTDAYKFSMTGARRADPLRIFGVDSEWVKENNVSKLTFKIMYPESRTDIGNVAIFSQSEANVRLWAVSLHMAHEMSQNSGSIKLYDEDGNLLAGVPSSGFAGKWYTVEINLQNVESLDCKYDNLNIKIVDESNLELYIAEATFLKKATYTVNHYKNNGEGSYTIADTFENVATTVGYNEIPIMDYSGYYARQDVNGFCYYVSENSDENVFNIYYEIKTVQVQPLSVSYLGENLSGINFSAEENAKINLTETTLGGEKAWAYTAFEPGRSLSLRDITAQQIKDAGYSLFRIDIMTESENAEQLIQDLRFKYAGGAEGVPQGWGGTIAEKVYLVNLPYIRLFDSNGNYIYYGSVTSGLITAGEWYTLEVTLPEPQDTADGVGIELYTNVLGRTIYLRNAQFAKDVSSVKITTESGEETAYSFGKATGTENYTILVERNVAGKKALAFTPNVGGFGLTFLNMTAENVTENGYVKFLIDVYSPDADKFNLNNLQHSANVGGVNSTIFNRPIFTGMAGNEQYYRVYDAAGNAVTALADTMYGTWFTIEYNVSNSGATSNDGISGFIAHLYAGGAAKNHTLYFANPRFVVNDHMEVACEASSVQAKFGTTAQTNANVRFDNVGTVAGKNAYAMKDNATLDNASSLTLTGLTAAQITENNLQSFRIKIYSESAEKYNLANLFFKVYVGGSYNEYRINSGNLTGNKYAALYASDGRRITDGVYGEWLTLEFNLAYSNGSTSYGGMSVELYSSGSASKYKLNSVYFAEAELVEKADIAIVGNIAGAYLGSAGVNTSVTSVGNYAEKENVFRYEVSLAKEVITLKGVTAEQLTESGYTKFLIDIYSPSAATMNLSSEFSFMIAISPTNTQWGYHTFTTKAESGNADFLRYIDSDGNPVYSSGGANSLSYGAWYTLEIDLTQKVNTLKGFIFELTSQTGATSVYLANARFS